jgi:hypothetical protein
LNNIYLNSSNVVEREEGRKEGRKEEMNNDRTVK